MNLCCWQGRHTATYNRGEVREFDDRRRLLCWRKGSTHSEECHAQFSWGLYSISRLGLDLSSYSTCFQNLRCLTHGRLSWLQTNSIYSPNHKCYIYCRTTIHVIGPHVMQGALDFVGLSPTKKTVLKILHNISGVIKPARFVLVSYRNIRSEVGCNADEHTSSRRAIIY